MLFPQPHLNDCSTKDLRELYLGEWEGLPRNHVRTCAPDAWKARGEDFAEFRPPGGESFADLQLRATRCIDRMRAEAQGAALVVTHAGVVRVMLCTILGMPLSHLFRIHIDYGGLTVIDYERTSPRVCAVNIRPACGDDHVFCRVDDG
jgi:probable phosphoglycerate mutase